MQSTIIASEQHHLRALRVCNPEVNVDIYKACVAVSNTGVSLPEEKQLSTEERILLNARRNIFHHKFDLAEEMLNEITYASHLLEGDRIFLLGQVNHRRGKQDEACRLMNEAANHYRLFGDSHRELRARVNGALCISTLESCLYGDLSVYEQDARQKNFLDIVANICRSRSMELLIANRLPEAYAQAIEASSLYLLDGYRDDRAVALILAAIIQLCMGNVQKAVAHRSEAIIDEGKTTIYIDIYNDLLAGKLPKVPKGHSLFKTSWKKVVVKTESVTGKIIEALRSNPRTRDELIACVWGENAMDQSYCSRLHTAVNAIRKENVYTILFDGEKYNLVTE